MIKFLWIFFLRLRHLLRRIQKDDISKQDLQKNIEYAASVLETVYIDETRLVTLSPQFCILMARFFCA